MIATYNKKDIVLFKTNIGHAGEFIDEILDKRSKDLQIPKLMSDAASQNKPSRQKVIWCLCNAHARRQFFDLIDDHPEFCQKIVSYFDRIFENEGKYFEEILEDNTIISNNIKVLNNEIIY